MDKEILKKIVIPDLGKLKDQSYIIYGTAEMADIYYDVISEKYGEQSIFGFLDGRNNLNTIKNNKKIMHYTELNRLQVNEYKYVLATISASSASMRKRLLEGGVLEENIMPTVSYFDVDKLRETMKKTDEIYIFPEFEDEATWQEFYNRTSKFVEFDKLKIKFHIFINSKEPKANIKNIIFHNELFNYENDNNILTLVRKAESICELLERHEDKIFCIDESFMRNLERKMLAVINEKRIDKKGRDYYKNISGNNFIRMKEESNKYKVATVFGAGPSLAEGVSSNQELLKSSFNIVCNDFFKLDEVMDKLQPKIYALSDSLYYTELYYNERAKIVKYINENDCWLCMNLEYVSYLVQQYGLEENKVIGFEFVKDEVVFPKEDNLKLYIGGSVVLTCSFPIAFTLKECVYVIGCDGTTIKDNKNWEYQKGICAETDKIDTNDRVFGTRSLASSSFLPKIQAGYERIIPYAVAQGKQYYTLTHSNFDLLEKNYIEL